MRAYNFDKGADINNVDTVTPSYDVGTPATNFCRSRKANKRKRTLGKVRIALKVLEMDRNRSEKRDFSAFFAKKRQNVAIFLHLHLLPYQPHYHARQDPSGEGREAVYKSFQSEKGVVFRPR